MISKTVRVFFWPTLYIKSKINLRSMSVKAIKHNNSVNNTVRHLSTCCTCISQTTLTSAVVRNLSPQLWHQFRITAVNIYGSQGPTEPSSPFSLLFGLSKFLRFSLYNKITNDYYYTNSTSFLSLSHFHSWWWWWWWWWWHFHSSLLSLSNFHFSSSALSVAVLASGANATCI